MARAVDYAGAWQRLNEALAMNVAMAEGDAEMFAFLLTSTIASFTTQGLLDDGSSTGAIELLHQLHQVDV